MSEITVLAAGDHFVLNELLVEEVRHAVPDAVVSELVLPWPHVPFHAIGEVDEASGSEEELIESLRGVQVCVTQMAPLTERVIRASPDLKLFAVSRGGPVNANLQAARAAGITVTFAPGRNAVATAEYTVAMMLAAMRRIPSTNASMKVNDWASSLYAFEETGLELEGSTVGLIGAGAIGSRVARILIGFGATVLIHDPYADVSSLPAGVRLVGLDELLHASQVVSLHARVTDETRGIMNSERLRSLAPGSVLVNCARGALLDYRATADALRSGRLRAAAFDVYDIEPLPADHPLRTAPNVVMTPHLAGASQQVARRAAHMVAAEVQRWSAGLPALHAAN